MIHQLSTLLKNTAWFTAFGLIARFQTFLLLPIYVRYLSVEEVGVQEWLVLISGVIGMTVSIEICQGLERQIGLAGDDLKHRHNAIRTAFVFFVTLNILSTVLFQLFSSEVSVLFFSTAFYAEHIRLASMSFLAVSIYTFVYNLNRYLLEAKRAALISYIQSTGTLVSGLLLVTVLGYGLFGSLAAPLCGSVLVITIFLPSLLRILDAGAFKFALLRQMLGFSAPLVAASIAFVLLSFTDRLMISHFLGTEPLGLYGVAFKIGLIVTVLVMGLQAAMMPLVYRYEKEAETREMLSTSFLLFLAFAFCCVLNLGLLSEYLVLIIATPDYLDAVILVPILAISLLFTRLYIFMPGLNIAGKTGIYGALHLLAFGVNVILNYVLVERFGILGASIATYLSALVLFGLLYIFSQRHYHVRHKLPQILILFLTMHLLISVFYLAKTMFMLSLVGQLALFIFANIGYIGLVFALGVIRLDQLGQIRKLLSK